MSDIRKRVGRKGVTYQVRYPSISSNSGYAFKSFKSMKEAKYFAAGRELDRNGSKPADKILVVEEAVCKWIDVCEKIGRDGREKVEPQTLVEYRRRAKVICKYPWDKYIHELTPPDIAKFRNWLLEHFTRDLSRRALSSFHSVLIEMKLHGYITADPAAGITIKTGGRYEDEHAEVEIPSDQEMRNILGAADVMGKKNDFMGIAWARYRPMIYLPVFSGIRMSENRGLPWEHLHSDRIDVRQRADKLGIVGPVKSKAARRSIELSTIVTDMIFEWGERCPESEYDLVFPTSTGRPIYSNNFSTDAWLPLFKEADLMVMRTARGTRKLRPKYTPHNLRHYYASKLIAKGKDPKFIQERMGHSSIEITFNVYGHLMKDREDEHRQTADELVNDLLQI